MSNSPFAVIEQIRERCGFTLMDMEQIQLFMYADQNTQQRMAASIFKELLDPVIEATKSLDYTGKTQAEVIQLFRDEYDKVQPGWFDKYGWLMVGAAVDDFAVDFAFDQKDPNRVITICGNGFQAALNGAHPFFKPFRLAAYDLEEGLRVARMVKLALDNKLTVENWRGRIEKMLIDDPTLLDDKTALKQTAEAIAEQAADVQQRAEEQPQQEPLEEINLLDMAEVQGFQVLKAAQTDLHTFYAVDADGNTRIRTAVGERLYIPEDKIISESLFGVMNSTHLRSTDEIAKSITNAFHLAMLANVATNKVVVELTPPGEFTSDQGLMKNWDEWSDSVIKMLAEQAALIYAEPEAMTVRFEVQMFCDLLANANTEGFLENGISEFTMTKNLPLFVYGLHSMTEEFRQIWMGALHPPQDVMRMLSKYRRVNGGDYRVAYTLISGRNDDLEEIAKLANFLNAVICKNVELQFFINRSTAFRVSPTPTDHAANVKLYLEQRGLNVTHRAIFNKVA